MRTVHGGGDYSSRPQPRRRFWSAVIAGGVRQPARAYLDRMIEVLRQSKTLQLPGNVLQLESISPLAGREYLHAEGVAKNGSEKRIALVFGPENGAVGSHYVYDAHTEALQQGFQQLSCSASPSTRRRAKCSAGSRYRRPTCRLRPTWSCRTCSRLRNLAKSSPSPACLMWRSKRQGRRRIAHRQIFDLPQPPQRSRAPPH